MVTAVESSEVSRELPKLLERVQQGERFVITLHGNPVAELFPIQRQPSRASLDETIHALRELRSRTVPTTPDEIREMINEGRP